MSRDTERDIVERFVREVTRLRARPSEECGKKFCVCGHDIFSHAEGTAVPGVWNCTVEGCACHTFKWADRCTNPLPCPTHSAPTSSGGETGHHPDCPKGRYALTAPILDCMCAALRSGSEPAPERCVWCKESVGSQLYCPIASTDDGQEPCTAPAPHPDESDVGSPVSDAEVFACPNCRVVGVSVEEDGLCVTCGVETQVFTLAARLRTAPAPSEDEVVRGKLHMCPGCGTAVHVDDQPAPSEEVIEALEIAEGVIFAIADGDFDPPQAYVTLDEIKTIQAALRTLTGQSEGLTLGYFTGEDTTPGPSEGGDDG